MNVSTFKTQNTYYVIGLIILLCTSELSAQTPNTLIDFESTQKGVLLPRMTTTQRNLITPNANEEGLIVYDTSEDALYQWTGDKWIKMSSNWDLQSNDLLFYQGGRNADAVRINNTPADSTFASGLLVFANRNAISGTSTVSGTGVVGTGRNGVFGLSTDGGAGVVGVSTGTSRAGSFIGEVVVDGVMTSDTLISTDQLLRIKPTSTAYTCDATSDGMIQYFNNQLRACIDTGSGPVWVDLH